MYIDLNNVFHQKIIKFPNVLLINNAVALAATKRANGMIEHSSVYVTRRIVDI
jgi:hypothetical protein